MSNIFKELIGEIPMKVRYITFFLIGFFSCAIPWLMSCNSVKEIIENIPDDSIVEELAEEVIEHYTGFEIDLTPSSQELK
jgi:hypothetical protein